MLLLVSGASATLRRYHAPHALGALLVPGAGNAVRPLAAAGLAWAADNAAFSGFDPGAFCALLGRIAGAPGCRFVACPDVVGDAAATLRLFEVWQPVLAALGLPVALVGQDGAERLALPWGRFQALFLGGSTAWKLGPGAAALAAEAKRRGLWLHLGRCNSRRRFRHAHGLACDSVDGSGFSRWPDRRIPLALNWLAELNGRADGTGSVPLSADAPYGRPDATRVGPGRRPRPSGVAVAPEPPPVPPTGHSCPSGGGLAWPRGCGAEVIRGRPRTAHA
jgi:hypothetical protein